MYSDTNGGPCCVPITPALGQGFESSQHPLRCPQCPLRAAIQLMRAYAESCSEGVAIDLVDVTAVLGHCFCQKIEVLVQQRRQFSRRVLLGDLPESPQLRAQHYGVASNLGLSQHAVGACMRPLTRRIFGRCAGVLAPLFVGNGSNSLPRCFTHGDLPARRHARANEHKPISSDGVRQSHAAMCSCPAARTKLPCCSTYLTGSVTWPLLVSAHRGAGRRSLPTPAARCRSVPCADRESALSARRGSVSSRRGE